MDSGTKPPALTLVDVGVLTQEQADQLKCITCLKTGANTMCFVCFEYIHIGKWHPGKAHSDVCGRLRKDLSDPNVAVSICCMCSSRDSNDIQLKKGPGDES